MEMLGKSRFLRAGLRLEDEAAALLAGLAGPPVADQPQTASAIEPKFR